MFLFDVKNRTDLNRYYISLTSVIRHKLYPVRKAAFIPWFRSFHFPFECEDFFTTRCFAERSYTISTRLSVRLWSWCTVVI